MTTILTKNKENKKKLLSTMAECIRGFNENEKKKKKQNNFDENYKKIAECSGIHEA